MANLPADLPTNWTQGQIISPNGTEVGLTEQYGYNYLNEQVNNTQTEVNSLSTAQTSTQQQVNTLNTQVGNIQGQVTTHGQSITNLQETTTTQGQNITTLQGQVSTLNQTTTTQGENISTLQNEVSAINTALDGVAQESSVQDIIDSIGATNDSGATATTGTLMAKVNDLIVNPRVVKSRQEIVIKGQKVTLQDNDFYNRQGSAAAYDAYYVDFNIGTINIDKTLIITNTATVVQDNDSLFPCARIINSNTIRVYQTSSAGNEYVTGVYVQIVEFY